MALGWIVQPKSAGSNSFLFGSGGSEYQWPYNFSSLEEIVIPNSVTRLGFGLFSGCGNLKKVIIPSGVDEMGNGFRGPFADCLLLASAGPLGSGCNIEFGWTDKIPDSAFAGCASLKEITIPDPISSIGKLAFYCCYNLEKVTLSDSIAHIGASAFHCCEK